MEPNDVVLALLEALKFFRTQYLSSAYSTMGFTVIAVGWLITSRSARVFIHTHRWLGISAIVMLVLSYIGFWRISLTVQSTSQEIADTLMSLGVEGHIYNHYTLSLPGVRGFLLMQGLAALFLSLVIAAVMRDPGRE